MPLPHFVAHSVGHLPLSHFSSISLSLSVCVEPVIVCCKKFNNCSLAALKLIPQASAAASAAASAFAATAAAINYINCKVFLSQPSQGKLRKIGLEQN